MITQRIHIKSSVLSPHMRSIYIIVMFLCMIQFEISAQNENTQKIDSITFTGKIYDRLTSRHVVGTSIEVLAPDSTVLSKTTGGRYFESWGKQGSNSTVRKDSTSAYSINVPRFNGNYLIKVEKSGYEPYFLSYNLELGKREYEKELPDIFLGRKKITTLDEVTVRASKVKFYNKGDTIIYNASAFSLPEGSMLDALIQQMPGVTIKDGQIYVNGRFVESLLLNGKDFFNNNKNVLMNNIGAYAVKDIAVYEKKDDMAYLLGEREDIDKEYVMDVRLKKDYMTGHFINAEVGLGTSSRYLGRIFGLQYTNNSRLALYGNANNINRSDNLSDSNRMREVGDGSGITKRTNGGVDYSVENTMRTWSLNGNVDASYLDHDLSETTNAVNYFQDANTYEFSNSQTNTRKFNISTLHTFKLKKQKWNLTIKPKFTYNKNKSNDETTAATFNKEMQNLDSQIIKALFLSDNKTLREALINRNLKQYESSQHGYNATLNADSKIKIPGTSDALNLKLVASYVRNSLFGKTTQDICYGGIPESSLLMMRTTSTRPEYNFNIQGTGQYYFSLPVGSLNASYVYAHSEARQNSDIMKLESLAENDMAYFDPTDIPVPDFANSFTSKLYRNVHQLNMIWKYDKAFRQGKLTLGFKPNVILENQHLYYHRAGTYADPSRTNFKFNITNADIEWTSRDKKQNYYLSYKLDQMSVNLINLVDIRDDVDPLNIILGNPDLKNATKHYVYFSTSYKRNGRLNQGLSLSAQWIRNDMVNGYRYDSETGVKTTKTYNVSGNYNYSLTHYIYYNFGHLERFFIDNDLNARLLRYADMIGYDSEPEKQYVNSRNLREDFTIGYMSDEYGVSIVGMLDLANNSSYGYAPVKNTYGYSGVRASLWADFPFKLSVSTDINAIKRFGYIDHSMNKFNVFWNAEVGYSILKGALKFTLQAKDILNQQRDISAELSAMGRRQTVCMTLPRYVMLKVQYRFDFKPKRKK